MVSLTPMATECLQCLYLNDQDQEIIRNCVAKYTEANLETINLQHTSLKQLVSLVTFHISEAVKWVCSVIAWQNLTTWQIATATIKNRALQLASEQGATPQEINRIHKTFPFTMNLFTKQVLTSCIVYNRHSTGTLFEGTKNYYDLRQRMQDHLAAVRS